MAKKDIRKCRYDFCKHESQEIDISVDKYVKDGRCFYHQDCYHKKKKGDAKTEQQKNDLKLIIDLWTNHISKTVVYPQLMTELNKLLARGIESEYLVFVIQYVIDNKLNLHYPGGFKYFVDKVEIKNAYANRNKLHVDIQSFKATTQKEETKFKPNIKKTTGFGDILNRG